MEPLIKHLVDITGHRDHRQLDVAVVSALYELVQASQVRAFEIFLYQDQLLVRPTVWLVNGQIESNDEILSNDHGGVPLSNYPVLSACMKGHIQSAEEGGADGKFILWLPIWLNDKVSTCLQIVNDTPFTANSRDIIDGILGVYRNYQSLLDYSERDSLTGLLNRKTFDEKFSKMVTSMPADEDPLEAGQVERRHASDSSEQWLAVVDIDHFKRVNDQFGHLYGDEVLILVANLLRHSFRAQDRVFRFGGEEFVILLRSTARPDAYGIFERFRASIEQHVFPQVGQVTVSVGFASINPYETPVVLLGHADQALYFAKEHGRNQVCNYEDLVEAGSLQSDSAPASMEFFFDAPGE